MSDDEENGAGQNNGNNAPKLFMRALDTKDLSDALVGMIYSIRELDIGSRSTRILLSFFYLPFPSLLILGNCWGYIKAYGTGWTSRELI